MTDTGFAPTPSSARLMIGSGLGGTASCVDTHATDGSGGDSPMVFGLTGAVHELIASLVTR